jgi:hypothetical protein
MDKVDGTELDKSECIKLGFSWIQTIQPPSTPDSLLSSRMDAIPRGLVVNANIDTFEMSYEESVSDFKRLENLENIRHTNGTNPSSLPVDNKKWGFFTSSLGKPSKNHKGSNIWCHYCDKNNHNTADCRAIAKFKQQKYNKARFEAEPRAGKKSLAFLFVFEEINALKGNRSLKRLQAVRRGRLNPSSLLATEINLTTSSHDAEQQEYLFTSSNPLSSSKTKLPKSSHPTNNQWVGSESHCQQWRTSAQSASWCWCQQQHHSWGIYLSPIHQNRWQ